VREEDYAAVMMAIKPSLAAVSLGLGTHIKTGADERPVARAAIVSAMLNASRSSISAFRWAAGTRHPTPGQRPLTPGQRKLPRATGAALAMALAVSTACGLVGG
jgi:hypothetical protein